MIRYFTMGEDDYERAANAIHERVLQGGYADKITGWVSADDLRTFPDLHIELAEDEGKIMGFVSWQVTYSTWRGLKGIYINDQHAVDNNRHVLEGLLKRCISRGLAHGAQYVRTEAYITEEMLISTYEKAGFWNVLRRAQYYLEAKNFKAFVDHEKLTPLP